MLIVQGSRQYSQLGSDLSSLVAEDRHVARPVSSDLTCEQFSTTLRLSSRAFALESGVLSSTLVHRKLCTTVNGRLCRPHKLLCDLPSESHAEPYTGTVTV